VRFIAKEWLAQAWYSVVNSGDPKHLAAGTQVQLVQSHRGVLSYAAKYTAKPQTLPDDWQEPGRWWGVVNRDDLGIEWKWCSLTEGQFWVATRVLRGLLARRARAQGRAPPRPCHSGMWAVLPDWQALRLARCVYSMGHSAPPSEPHAGSYRQSAGTGFRFQRPLGGLTVEVSAYVAHCEPCSDAPVAPL
jgi:hypothetical protein